jgi:hypothetical protein
MKIFVLALPLTLFTATATSQDSTITLSQFEKFIGHTATYTKTTFSTVGEFGSYKILKLVATEISTGKRSMALKLGSIFEGPFSHLIDAMSIYIDSAELDPVISTLEAFLIEVEKEHLTNDQVLNYTTLNDIHFTCYYERFNNRWSFSMNKIYQKLRTHVPGTYVSINKKRMKEFLSLLKQAKAGLGTP